MLTLTPNPVPLADFEEISLNDPVPLAKSAALPSPTQAVSAAAYGSIQVVDISNSARRGSRSLAVPQPSLPRSSCHVSSDRRNGYASAGVKQNRTHPPRVFSHSSSPALLSTAAPPRLTVDVGVNRPSLQTLPLGRPSVASLPSLTSQSLHASADPVLPNRLGFKQRPKHRRTPSELEREYDLHDGDDDVPEQFVMWNIPLTPRPLQDRLSSVEEETKSVASAPGGTTLKSNSLRTPTSPSDRPIMLSILPKSMTPVETTDSSSTSASKDDSSSRSSSTTTSNSSNSTGNNLLSATTTAPIASVSGELGSQNGSENVKAQVWKSAFTAMSADVRSLTYTLEEHATRRERQNVIAGVKTVKSASVPQSPTSSPHGLIPTLIKTKSLPPLRHHSDLDANDPAPLSREKAKFLARTRPSWLPPKSKKEEQRHLQEWRKMMAQAAARDIERKERERKQEALRERERGERLKKWKDAILPVWRSANSSTSAGLGGSTSPDLNALLSDPTTRDLWWKGVPPSVRAEVWKRAIGNDLSLTKASFEAALDRTRGRWAEEHGTWQDSPAGINVVNLTKEVFPELNMFAPGGPMHDSLVELLMAYSGYRGDIVFPQAEASSDRTDDSDQNTDEKSSSGASSNSVRSPCSSVPPVQLHRIAGLLLLTMLDPADSFIALANILNRPTPLAYLLADGNGIQNARSRVLGTLALKKPMLARLFVSQSPSASDIAEPAISAVRDDERKVVKRVFTPLSGMSIPRFSSDSTTSATAPSASTSMSGPSVHSNTDFLTYNRHRLETLVDTILSSLFSAKGVVTVDVLARIWDVYVFEGEAVLTRAAVAILMATEGGICAALEKANTNECRSVDSGDVAYATRDSMSSSSSLSSVSIPMSVDNASKPCSSVSEAEGESDTISSSNNTSISSSSLLDIILLSRSSTSTSTGSSSTNNCSNPSAALAVQMQDDEFVSLLRLAGTAADR